MAGASSDGESLEALLEQNLILRAEHEALIEEALEVGMALELPSPTQASPQTGDLVSRSRLDALREEQQVLMQVTRLGEQLEDLHAVNAKLRQEAAELREENATLATQNAAMRERTQNATPPLAAVRNPSVPVKPQAVKGDTAADGNILPANLAKRADEISMAIKQGRFDKLNANEEERRELVAAMIKAGLSASYPQQDQENLGPITALQAAVASQSTATSQQQPQTAYVSQAPPQPRSMPSQPASQALAGAPRAAPAPDPVPATTAAREPARPAASTTQTSSAPARPAQASTPLEKRAQEIAEALRRGDRQALSSCNEEERKELVGEMLRQGVFTGSAPIPGTPQPTGTMPSSQKMDETQRDNAERLVQARLEAVVAGQQKTWHVGVGASGVEMPDGMDDDNFRERFIREKLQEMKTQQNA